jgi:hypothetical protein
MSYALDVEPDARAAFGVLEVDAQEAILDLLDQLTADGPALTPDYQRHLVVAQTPTGVTYAFLNLTISHAHRTVHLAAIEALVT